jgi:prepilin peptidase CpaA
LEWAFRKEDGMIKVMNMIMDPFLVFLLISLLVIAALKDLHSKKIPNILTYPSMLIALNYHFVIGGLNGLLFSLEGLVLGVALFIIPYLLGGMGAGDAKLMGAVGAIIGPKGLFIAAVLTAFVGGLCALIILLTHQQFSKSFIKRYTITLKTFLWTGKFIPIPADQKERQPKLRYGVVIALGTLLYIFLETSGYKFFI